ncbi:EcsC family protein [Halobacillus mangrovi]|uniref:ABC transporter-associated protein EcsC n=1 Tax=Halobacillus mangrovi TaxID=402384 RepID=A0A1W5ZXQ4_9BACI|nr:EcsC family protein [Halobacillus mangrovi]ARI78098.1 ABC transporter-associated protein EcsC [Halobacillus mangrovi]
MDYETKVKKEAERWSRSLEKRSSVLQRTSKRFQSSINQKIPDQIHNVVTESIRKMIEVSLTTSEYIRPVDLNTSMSFQEREQLVTERLDQYKKTAAFEGAGTGFGGFWLGAADFPLLLSIKMKFIFDAGQIYGLDVRKYEERVFLLHLFMLAFSSDEARENVRGKVLNWNHLDRKQKHMDWRTLQIEYRDTLDFVKLFQLIPGFGAVVGYVANGRMLEHLGETTMNACRLRLL